MSNRQIVVRELPQGPLQEHHFELPPGGPAAARAGTGVDPNRAAVA